MERKLQTIKNMRSKLAQIQKQLNKTQNTKYVQNNKRSLSKNSLSPKYNQSNKKNSFNKTMNIKNYNTLPTQTRSKQKDWKNPTFWGGNPILGKQNQHISPSKWQKKKKYQRGNIQLSPKLYQTQKVLQSNFYNNAKPIQRPKKQLIYQKLYSTQKYKFSAAGLQSKDTPRFERQTKIKTFHQNTRYKNPILYPQSQIPKGKKIINRGSLSPNQNLIQNPKSNPRIYYFGQNMVKLSPKANNRRNLSPNIAQSLSYSLQQKAKSPNARSCKKHFSKYFVDNLSSQIYF